MDNPHASGKHIGMLQQQPQKKPLSPSAQKKHAAQRRAQQNRRAKLDTSRWDAMEYDKKHLMVYAAKLKRMVIQHRSLLAKQDKQLYDKFRHLESWLVGYGFDIRDCADFYATEERHEA